MKHSMKKFFIPFISILIGFALSFFAFRSRPALLATADEVGPRAQYDAVFDADDPLSEMDEIHQRMREQIRNFQRGDFNLEEPIGKRILTRFSRNEMSRVQRREDERYVYLDVGIKDLSSATIDTTVVDEYVTLSGTVEKKHRNGVMRSSFSRTLPVPDGVDQNQMAVVPEKDKVTLRFPKLKV